MKFCLPFLAIVSLLSGCGSSDPVGYGDGGIGGGERMLPLSVGATWTYQVTKDDEVTEKVTTVEAIETLTGDKEGVTAFRIRTVKTGGETVSWQEDTGTSILRHAEESYDSSGFNELSETYSPYKLRIDESSERLALGATFTDAYTETVTDNEDGSTSYNEKSDIWTVVALDDEVTVPAGTFTCVLLHKQGSADGQSDKYYWFSAGVGKVKEAGGQLEELVSYSVGE